jgi:hypothetical protein
VPAAYDYMTAAEAAERMDVKPPAVYQAIIRGKLRARKFHCPSCKRICVFVTPAAVDGYMARSRTRAIPPLIRDRIAALAAEGLGAAAIARTVNAETGRSLRRSTVHRLMPRAAA